MMAWVLQELRLHQQAERGGALSTVRAQCNYSGVWPY